MNARRTQIEMFSVVGAIVGFMVLMLALNATGTVDVFTVNLWGKYLCYAVLAMSVDLLWGYTGLLSLGQAMFFALGGYMMGMHLMLMEGVVSKSGQPMAAFLSGMLGWEELPKFWVPFSNFAFATVMVVVLPALVAGVFGFLAFRSRIKGVYFSILTQALTYGACLMFFRNEHGNQWRCLRPR